ncbi:hypothetical protein VYU27_009169 [Nannochloropsis oceanica]
MLSSSNSNRARWAEVVGGVPSSSSSSSSSSFQGPMGRRGGGREGGREGGLGFSGESGGKICRFFIQGNCAHGDRCHNSHDPSALPPSVPPFLTPPVSSAQLNEGAGPARGEEEMRLVVEEEERRSREAECMICTDAITGRFGLLTHCAHSFCLSCIRTWRQQHTDGSQDTANVRSCPCCKQVSHFVIPHTRLVTDPLRKENLIQAYKDQMKQKRCRYFVYQRGGWHAPNAAESEDENGRGREGGSSA